MPNYQEAKIYAIRSHLTDKIYIGSTCQQLHMRFYDHKKRLICKAKDIIALGDAYIELIENYPCNDRNELFKREGHHIRSNNCVNKQIPDGMPQSVEKIVKWQEDNKEKVKEYKRNWYLKQKELKNQTI